MHGPGRHPEEAVLAGAKHPDRGSGQAEGILARDGEALDTWPQIAWEGAGGSGGER